MAEKETVVHPAEILEKMDPKEICRVYKRFVESLKYFEQNYGDIVKKYAGCIVAVVPGKIVSVPFFCIYIISLFYLIKSQ